MLLNVFCVKTSVHDEPEGRTIMRKDLPRILVVALLVVGAILLLISTMPSNHQKKPGGYLKPSDRNLSAYTRKFLGNGQEVRQHAKASGLSVSCYVQEVRQTNRPEKGYPDRIVHLCGGGVIAGRTIISEGILGDMKKHPIRDGV